MIRKQENNKILIISHMADCDGMGSVTAYDYWQAQSMIYKIMNHYINTGKW